METDLYATLEAQEERLGNPLLIVQHLHHQREHLVIFHPPLLLVYYQHHHCHSKHSYINSHQCYMLKTPTSMQTQCHNN